MLHRPYIRKDVVQAVEDKAPQNDEGQFLDANTNEPIVGSYDLGHKAEHEFWREQEKAEQEGLTQAEFNDRMNNPDLYQIEDPHNNRSHQFEDKSESMSDLDVDENQNARSDNQSMDSLEGLEPIKPNETNNENDHNQDYHA